MFPATLELHDMQNHNIMAECNYSAGALATVKKLLYGGKAEGI